MGRLFLSSLNTPLRTCVVKIRRLRSNRETQRSASYNIREQYFEFVKKSFHVHPHFLTTAGSFFLRAKIVKTGTKKILPIKNLFPRKILQSGRLRVRENTFWDYLILPSVAFHFGVIQISSSNEAHLPF